MNRSQLSGRVEIKPPVPVDRVGAHTGRTLRFVVAREFVTKPVVTGIEPVRTDLVDARGTEDELRNMVDALPGGCTLAGFIARSGQELGDAERYVPDGPEILTIRPRLVWPDGEETRADGVRRHCGAPGFGGNALFLLRDKPHRCPSCYAPGRRLFRGGRWIFHWCVFCEYAWGGRVLPPLWRRVAGRVGARIEDLKRGW